MAARKARFTGSLTFVTRSIFVAAPEGQTGKSVVALGLIDALTREVGSVGVFRPIVKNTNKHDEILENLVAQPGVQLAYDEAVGVTYSEIRSDPDEAMATIVTKFGAMAERFEAVVVLGSDYTDVASNTELAFNAKVAANLGASVVLAVSARGRAPEEVRAIAEGAIAEFIRAHNKVVAVIVTRVADDPDSIKAFEWALSTIPDIITFAMPAHPLLAAPTIGAQLEAAQAKLLAGPHDRLDLESQGVLVAGMTLPNVLPRLFADAMVLLPGDRFEMIPGILLAHVSGSFPQLAGLLLVGGYEVPPVIRQLIETVPHKLPIASTDLGTYTTAQKLFHLEGTMTSSPRKVEIGRRVFSEHVDARRILDAIDVAPSKIRTPLMFEYQLNEMARSNKRRIVLPESGDDRILEAASIVLRRGTAEITLLGNPTEVKGRATQLGFSLEGAEIIDMTDPELVEKFSAEYAKLRSKKGVTIEQAKQRMTDPSYFGTMMVHFGMADGMVSGAVNTTANTIRPSLEFIKTKPGVKVVSSSFLMCMENRVDVYGDCAVNPDPNEEQLADIAISSAETAAAFGIEPRVAMLSYSTGESGKGADVDKVRAATEIVKERAPELKVEGPIQFDAAVDPTVGNKKMPGSEVAGQATVFIFPDLNTGNNTYKAVQRSAGALAVGPVLQGLNKPVNDLSRGALVDDIVNTIAITAIQAQQ